MIATSSIIQSGLPLHAGRWIVDSTRSTLSFSIRQLGFAKVRGRFDRFAVTLDVGRNLAETRVEAIIDTDSIDTNNADRDRHLRSRDFFSTDDFPTMTFVSTEIRLAVSGWTLRGELSLNGVTRPQTLNVEFVGVATAPDEDHQRAGFSATGALRRSNFGISYGMLPFGADRLALSDEVKIELDLAFIGPWE